MKVVTLVPIRSHFCLKTGVNEQSEYYHEFLASLKGICPEITIPGLAPQRVDYETLAGDVRDSRLFVWSDHSSGEDYRLRIHVFSNAISVVEICFTDWGSSSAGEIEERAQERSRGIIQRTYPELYRIFRELAQHARPKYLVPLDSLSDLAPFDERRGVKICWIARTLRFEDGELGQPQVQDLIRAWLAETKRPDDADEIIAGHRNHSMTWLNYVLVESNRGELDYMVETMVLAQFYYAAQEGCNQQLRKAISKAYLAANPRETAQLLADRRAEIRLHLAQYHEQCKYLTRRKRQALEEIMASWEFENLLANGQRMIDICSSRIVETENRRQERSSFFTDLILVAIGFIAVFELTLHLSQYSREMMSRPALNFTDDQSSWILTTVAAVHTDSMLTAGAVAILALLGIYLYAKKH